MFFNEEIIDIVLLEQVNINALQIKDIESLKTNIHLGKPTLIHQIVIQNDRKYRLESYKKL